MLYFHLAFGIVVFAVFVITGRAIRADFPDKDAIPQEEVAADAVASYLHTLFSAASPGAGRISADTASSSTL